MNRNSFYSQLVICVICLLLFACSPTKRVPEGKYLLNRVKVKTDNSKVDKEELYAYSKLKPNKRILWSWRFHLWVYNRFKPESTNKLKETVGEPPVIFDSVLIKSSVSQMELALKNHGFYNNEVTYSIKKKGRKVNLKYNVHAGKAYKIRRVEYSVEDSYINNILMGDTSSSLLKPGKPFDINLLEQERNRITKLMKNNGYYYFSRNYVYFEADTTLGDREVGLALGIQNVVKTLNKRDSSKIEVQHERYKIRKIYVVIDNDNRQNDGEYMDTTIHDDIHFIQSPEYNYKSKAIERTIFINQGNYYLLRDQELTYQRLASLRNFKYINIAFEDAEDEEKNLLDCYIRLIPVLTQSVTVETNLTTSSGNNGTELNVNYTNLNRFNGAEILNVRLSGGLEVQQLTVEDAGRDVINSFPFNTVEFGPEVSLHFPRYLLPFRLSSFSKKNNPKTSMSVAYNYQQRPDYNRNLTNVSFSYSWYETKTKQHIIQPMDISFIRLNKSAAFEDLLLNSQNSLLINSYSDHFIMAAKYSYILNTQSINKKKDFLFFRGNIEFAGNSLAAISRLSNAPTVGEDDSYKAFNVRFAQYVRTDYEFKYYFTFDHSSLVLRTITGIGNPYGNLDVLPFEKSFFMGGSNDLRAWRARDLGPGSLPKSLTQDNNIDQIGEFKWEGNIEYRFDISKVFEGAFFTDFGNIWLLEKDEKRPNAEINSSRLWQDLAIGSGLGLRLDFNFFLIRFDFAVRVKDPGSEEPEKISINLNNSPILNFGIGYPF